jgi:small conductance mechanosensitive channel
MKLYKVLTSVLASAGVVGLAIGLALQGTLSNTVSRFILSFLPKISIRDWIETNDEKGFVTEINLRNVTIQRPENNFTLIPNSTFIENPFTNFSTTKRSRIMERCGVGYESDLHMVEDLTVRCISEEFKQDNEEEVELFFTEFGDSSINLLVRFCADYVNGKDNLMHQHKAIKTIKKHFDKTVLISHSQFAHWILVKIILRYFQTKRNKLDNTAINKRQLYGCLFIFCIIITQNPLDF